MDKKEDGDINPFPIKSKNVSDQILGSIMNGLSLELNDKKSDKIPDKNI